MPDARSTLTFVGSTERWIYGLMLASGEHAFIDDNGGRVLSRTLAAGRVHAAFQAQVAAFSTAFLRGRR